MLTTILALTLLAPSEPVCPIMGHPVGKSTLSVDYNGVRFTFCCAGCDTKFEANPKEAIADAVSKKRTIGKSLFDPVTGHRVNERGAKGFSDYGGIRYFFLTASSKPKFDADPAKLGKLATKDALVCPVTKEKIGGYANASEFVDFEGVRYYLCCSGCYDPMIKDSAKFALGMKDLVGEPKVANPAKGRTH